MTITSQSFAMSRHNSQTNCLDPLDGLVDFSDYEVYQSPSISPSSSKSQFVRPVPSTPASLIPPPQVMSGPSHQYDLHKQQTGIPVGGLANTLAINSSVYGGYGFSGSLSPGDGFIDFGSAPSHSSYGGLDMDMDFDSPSTSPAFFFPEQTLPSSSEFVNPSAIGGQENIVPSSIPTQQVGRVWPGMHQQAAIAKAQQQQKQQQQLIQQQRQNSISQQPRQQRPKAVPATDPIVEEKISQLLHSMRQGSIATSDGDDAATPHGNSGGSSRMRKDEDDMDEDERLLASEEGKKLSSKERRQLRNKVSARAFRSRRKEYIGQLEGEIAQKVNENSDLRAQNRALMEENTRLSDLTRMLLSSPSFSGFLDNLSANPNPVPQQQTQQPAATVKVEQSARPLPKDVNPYVAQQQLQSQQQINFALMPEQTMDFSLLDLNADYIFQPQVYSVLSLPEVSIDTSLLAGKSSNFVGRPFESEDEKVEMAVIDRQPISVKPEIAPEMEEVDEEFEADPAFALFADASPSHIDEEEVSKVFAGIVCEKTSTYFELVDVHDDEASAELAVSRVQRMYSSMDAIAARLEAMTMSL